MECIHSPSFLYCIYYNIIKIAIECYKKTAAMLKLFPGTKEKLIYLNTILIKPSLNEYWAVDLPKGFYWGYYFIRPYMLLKKYLTKQKVDRPLYLLYHKGIPCGH